MLNLDQMQVYNCTFQNNSKNKSEIEKKDVEKVRIVLGQRLYLLHKPISAVNKNRKVNPPILPWLWLFDSSWKFRHPVKFRI